MASHEAPAADPSDGRPAGDVPDMSIDDWDEVVGDLERQLARVDDDDPTAGASIHARWRHLYDGLVQLRAYYARVPAETARHCADPRFLRQVAAVAARRARLVEDLMAALERV